MKAPDYIICTLCLIAVLAYAVYIDLRLLNRIEKNKDTLELIMMHLEIIDVDVGEVPAIPAHKEMASTKGGFVDEFGNPFPNDIYKVRWGK